MQVRWMPIVVVLGCSVQHGSVIAQSGPRALQILRVAPLEPGQILVAVTVRKAPSSVPLQSDTASAYLKNGRRLDVARFVILVAPQLVTGQVEQPFNTTVVLTSPRSGARLGRADSSIGDMTPVPRASTVYFCGSHFGDDTLYLEMVFGASEADTPADILRVEVLGHSAVPTAENLVEFWTVPNNQVLIENATAADIVVRLKGPTAAGARIPASTSETLPALEGKYYLEYELTGIRRDTSGTSPSL